MHQFSRPGASHVNRARSIGFQNELSKGGLDSEMIFGCSPSCPYLFAKYMKGSRNIIAFFVLGSLIGCTPAFYAELLGSNRRSFLKFFSAILPGAWPVPIFSSAQFRRWRRTEYKMDGQHFPISLLPIGVPWMAHTYPLTIIYLSTNSPRREGPSQGAEPSIWYQ